MIYDLTAGRPVTIDEAAAQLALNARWPQEPAPQLGAGVGEFERADELVSEVIAENERLLAHVAELEAELGMFRALARAHQRCLQVRDLSVT